MLKRSKQVWFLSIAVLLACTEARIPTTAPGAPGAPEALIVPPCADCAPTTVPSYTTGIDVPGYTNTYCRSAVTYTAADVDGDRLRDECEYQLAAAFAPMLVQPNEDYWGVGAGVPGEYLFAVGPAPSSAGIRIAYMPAYYMDWGDVYTGSDAHTGDSEFIIVEVLNDVGTTRWRTTTVFLSSHCGALLPLIGFFEADPNCQWYGPENFAWINGTYQGAPVVWVSNSKHSNYFSYAKCQGGTLIDRCDEGTRVYRRFPISREFHIIPRSRLNWHLIPPRRASYPVVDPSKLEDFFGGATETSFNGWQSQHLGDAATPYGDILRLFNVYYNPGYTVSPPGGCDRTAKVC